MFGKNIKKIRSVHGLSQQQFAEIFDMKRATVGAYEEQRSNPKMETVIKIANHFSIDMEDLMTKELTVNNLLRFNETITTSPTSQAKDTKTGIPLVSSEDVKRFLTAIQTKTELKLANIIIPNLSPEDKTAFTVNDLYMSEGTPFFRPNDIVIAEKTSSEYYPTLNGDLVMVATKSQLLFRQAVYTDHSLILTAKLTGTPTMQIPVNELTALWKVVHVFHYSIPTDNDLEKRISALESKIANLNSTK